MPVFEHIPVNAYMIHKEHLDDVLVSNIRSELPTWLPVDALETEDLSPQERDLLARHYVAADLPGVTGQRLMRRSVPATLPADLLDAEGFEWAREYYKDCDGTLVLDAKYIPEQLEEALSAHCLETAQRISAADRHRIALLTDKMPCNLRSDRHAMTMINDLENYFFYRKHHEHVPGIMLVEVARQAVYAQYYRTSPHKRGEVTLSIKTLNCEFDDYVDSNYPVTVVVDTQDVTEELDTGTFDRRQARFYQRGRQVALVDIIGAPIKMKLFKRLRNVKPEPGDWFVPVKGFSPSVMFRDESGKRIDGKLRKVSQSGMDIVFAQQPAAHAPLEFVISVEGIGYIDGKVKPHALQTSPDGVIGRVDMLDLSLDCKRKWLEAIKNYSHLDPVAGA